MCKYFIKWKGVLKMEKECDVLVVGGGGGGLVAAVRAAQSSGKKVIVLEKAKKTGGGMQFARTMRTFGSKWQKERNLPDVTATYLRNVMDATYWRLDSDLALKTVRATGEFFDWFCELADPKEVELFHEGTYVFEEYGGPIGPQLDNPGDPTSSGRLFMDVMRRKCDEFGVEVLTSHRAVRSEVKNGKIVAVEAEGPEGNVLIHCKDCIIACGSWINNSDIVKKYYPEFYEAQKHMGKGPHTNPNYTGDGFKLLEGLDVEQDEKNFTLRLMGPMAMARNRVIGSMSNSPFVMVVNLNARRYICEPSQMRMGIFNSGLIQMEQPEGEVYILFDSNNLEAAIKDNKVHPVESRPPFGPTNFPDTLEEAQKEIREYLDKENPNNVYSADSVEELAAKISLDPATLAEQVRRYNDGCRKGFDDQCFKDAAYLVPLEKGPYYALKADLGTDGAFGGVLVNGDMQAYRKDGSLVDGLYVVGDFASGRFINMAGVKVQLINDMSWALASGFIAGTQVGSKK